MKYVKLDKVLYLLRTSVRTEVIYKNKALKKEEINKKRKKLFTDHIVIMENSVLIYAISKYETKLKEGKIFTT